MGESILSDMLYFQSLSEDNNLTVTQLLFLGNGCF